MAPSRTKQSRRARRVRRHYLTLALTAGDYTTPEEQAKFAAKLARAEAAVNACELIGWETRAEGFTGTDEEDEGEGDEEGDAAPKPRKKAKKAKARKASANKAQAAEQVAA